MSVFVNPPRLRTPLFAVVLGVAAALTGLAPSADGDIWWHLAAGREMVARQGLLSNELRLPMLPASAALAERLEAAVTALDRQFPVAGATLRAA